MIRALQKTDIDRVVEIWLGANLQAHSFIPAQYWESNLSAVKDMLPRAEVYVYESDQMIHGFIGLSGDYIEVLFVSEAMRSHGIGTCLLNFVKAKKPKLRLQVYQKNLRAIRFYQKEEFVIHHEGVDEDTGEKDYEMIWQPK